MNIIRTSIGKVHCLSLNECGHIGRIQYFLEIIFFKVLINSYIYISIKRALFELEVAVVS